MRKLMAAGVVVIVASVGSRAIGQTASGLFPRSTVPPPSSPGCRYIQQRARQQVVRRHRRRAAMPRSAPRPQPRLTSGALPACRLAAVRLGTPRPEPRVSACRHGWATTAGRADRVGRFRWFAHPDRAAATISNPPRHPIAAVTQGPASLPNEQGQVWREYDITPYTGARHQHQPARASVVDWVLRDTGYEAWHNEPLGILCANRRTLKVYHTPEMHAVVADVVDRFVSSEAESQTSWPANRHDRQPELAGQVAHQLLRPIAVQTQGIQAWLLQKEDAALLMAELRKRIDFREQSSPAPRGQQRAIDDHHQHAAAARTCATSFPSRKPGPTSSRNTAQFEEGFSLEFNPLLSLDGRSIDAVLKCNIDQLEKLIAVSLDVPSPAAPRQRAKMEVPQAICCRLHERFRWPSDQVLLVGLGMVASPRRTIRIRC